MAKENNSEKEKRKEALSRAISQIERQFGKGAVMRLGSDVKFEVPAIPTGALSLDIALGIGGMPRGRVIEIYGPEGSGKTTLSLHVIANAQKVGGMAAFIDAEHALDPDYARRIGVDLDDLIMHQPDSGEMALEVAELLVRSNAIDVLVVDSVAALVPRAEVEGEMGDTHVGLQARLMSQALRKLSGAINKSRTCMIFNNQIREKIGIMFGNPETTPGGRALKFYASVRIEVKRIGSIKDGDVITGSRTRASVTKNKVGPPYRKAEFDIMYNRAGISKEGDLLDLGLELGMIDKSGSWFSYNDTRLGQGRENAKDFLAENPEIMENIEKSIREKFGLIKTREGNGNEEPQDQEPA